MNDSDDTMNDPLHSEAAEPIRLPTFIRQGMPEIVEEWSRFARTRTPASNGMSAHALKDHIEEILTVIATDLETPQTSVEQVQKSHGDGPRESGVRHTPAETHAALRLSDGFDIDQMVSEYRALRASVTKLWSAARSGLNQRDLNDLIRFNEAIDQSVTESLSHYTELLDRSRNLFLGILGHDLRNPIGAASMFAEGMVASGTLNARQSILASQIADCTARASRIVDDLLDLTRLQFGSELSLSRARMNVAVLSERIIDEVRALYPGRSVDLKTTGSMDVEWDPSRMGQVLSNLIGNAMAHGFRDTAVTVLLRGEIDQVVVRIQNFGEPIPPEELAGVFELFRRGTTGIDQEISNQHLGLGLYITRKIVLAHGGTLSVTSSQETGTSFTAALPRTLDTSNVAL